MQEQDNKFIYNLVRSVPDWAKKQIQGGRLKGMTDIKPQWRIEVMTDLFGPIGVGWYYEISAIEYKEWGEQIACFVRINLFFKYNGEWSKAIPAMGGSMFNELETKGYYLSDECEKMALTDALSVAMKYLGVGADIYSGHSDTKYLKKEQKEQPATQQQPVTQQQPLLTPTYYKELKAVDLTIEDLRDNLTIERRKEVWLQWEAAKIANNAEESIKIIQKIKEEVNNERQKKSSK